MDIKTNRKLRSVNRMVAHAGAYVIGVQWLACCTISAIAELLIVFHLAAAAGLSA